MIEKVFWDLLGMILKSLISCGVWCSDLLGSLGSCQDRLRILFLGGGIGLESICLVSRI